VVLESWSWVGWFTVWFGYLGLGQEHTCLYEFYALGNGIGRPVYVFVILSWRGTTVTASFLVKQPAVAWD
jgi:hypothetical protein